MKALETTLDVYLLHFERYGCTDTFLINKQEDIYIEYSQFIGRKQWGLYHNK